MKKTPAFTAHRMEVLGQLLMTDAVRKVLAFYIAESKLFLIPVSLQRKAALICRSAIYPCGYRRRKLLPGNSNSISRRKKLESSQRLGDKGGAYVQVASSVSDSFILVEKLCDKSRKLENTETMHQDKRL